MRVVRVKMISWGEYNHRGHRDFRAYYSGIESKKRERKTKDTLFSSRITFSIATMLSYIKLLSKSHKTKNHTIGKEETCQRIT